MKAVFLDIDGVLNTSKTFIKRAHELKVNGVDNLEIDLFRLDYLKQILIRTNSNLVLSSSWRHFFYNDASPRTMKAIKLCRLLDKYDIRIDFVTPYLPCQKRSDEIKLWLSNHDVDNFLIIDDEPSLFDDLFDNMIITSKLNRNQMLMNMDDCNGLCEKDIDVAIDILNQKNKVKRK